MQLIRRLHLVSILVILLMLTPLVVGIFHQGFFVTDDGNWMVIRFSAFYQAFRDGQFPVRFLDRLYYGLGYPVSNFLYPGFLYLGIPLKAVGFNSLMVIKILMFSFMTGGAVFTFFWLRRFFPTIPAFAGAVTYTYLPYHIYNLYKRGSIGELMALTVLPFLLWMIERKSVFFTSLAVFALLVSHNTLALLFLIFIVFYALLRKRFKWLILPGITGSILSSFFTIPALFELKFTKFSLVEISNPFEHFAGWDLIGPGMVLLVILSVSTFVLVLVKRRMNDNYLLAVVFLVILLISIFLSTSLSRIIWGQIPSSWIQFPFRFLSLGLIASAFLTSYVVYMLFPKYRVILVILILVLTCISTKHYLFPKEYDYQEIGFYDTNESLTTTHDEYLPLTAEEIKSEHPKNWVEPFEGEIVITKIQKESDQISFQVSALTNGSIRINRIYFPGWNARVDGGKKIIPLVKNDGLMYVPILRGDHTVVMKFEETPLRAISNILSIIGIVLLLVTPAKLVINRLIK